MFSITALPADQLRQAQQLLNHSLGKGYLSIEQISRYLPQQPNSSKFSFVARNGNQLVGVATADLFDPANQVHEIIPADQRTVIDQVLTQLPSRNLLAVHSVAVAADWRKQGIAKALVAQLLSQGRAKGAEAAISVGWTDKSGCHLSSVLTQLGFRAQLVIDDYWFTDSRINDFACPSCAGACRCQATIFTLTKDAWLNC